MIANMQNNASTQFYEMIPFAEYLYTPFEKNYDATSSLEFAQNHMALPWIITGSYLLACWMGTIYMNRHHNERFDLKYPLVYWNAGLSFFSYMGAMRTVPELLYRVSMETTLTDTICRNPSSTWGNGASGFWVQLFVFSKIPELVDTVFIVARKRPLLFLHWYHHVTVLLYCWHSFATQAPQALYFVAMNYSVHAIMYGYYCLMALKMKPAWMSPFVITAAQITQMMVGMTVQMASSYKYLMDNNSCNMNGFNIAAGGAMYTSYFALFAKFALDRYYKPLPNAKTKPKLKEA
jgi:hypothetical protein